MELLLVWPIILLISVIFWGFVMVITSLIAVAIVSWFIAAVLWAIVLYDDWVFSRIPVDSSGEPVYSAAIDAALKGDIQ